MPMKQEQFYSFVSCNWDFDRAKWKTTKQSGQLFNRAQIDSNISLKKAGNKAPQGKRLEHASDFIPMTLPKNCLVFTSIIPPTFYPETLFLIQLLWVLLM